MRSLFSFRTSKKGPKLKHIGSKIYAMKKNPSNCSSTVTGVYQTCKTWLKLRLIEGLKKILVVSLDEHFDITTIFSVFSSQYPEVGG